MTENKMTYFILGQIEIFIHIKCVRKNLILPFTKLLYIQLSNILFKEILQHCLMVKSPLLYFCYKKLKKEEMLRLNLSKKLFLYSKQTSPSNESFIKKHCSYSLSTKPFMSLSFRLQFTNKFQHSTYVSDTMSNTAQQAEQASKPEHHEQKLSHEQKQKKQPYKKLDLHTVKQSASTLIHYDSVVVDNLCEIFSSIYINRSAKNLQIARQNYLKNKDLPKTDVQNLDEYWLGYFQQYIDRNFPRPQYLQNTSLNSTGVEISGHQIIQRNQQEIIEKIYIEVSSYRKQKKEKFLTFSQNLAKRFNLDQNDLRVESKRVFQSIRNIFKFLDKANIGFLRGDLHSETVFKINRYIQRLQNKDKSNLIGANFAIDDYKRLFDNVTEFNMFRLPKKGIKYYELQTKNNLYQRQLNVETVSSQQSFDKFHGAIHSLANVHKVHLTGAAKKYIIDWLPQMIESIKEEQMKCKIKDLDEKRILYAPYIVKINPQKIATVILSELVSEIMEVIFIGGQSECIQANEYYSISWRKLCRKVSSILNSQFLYEQEEKKFKSIQKLYDYIMNYELKKSSFSADDLNEPELEKLNKLCEHEINLKDLETFMKNLKIFDVEKPIQQKTQEKTQGMVKKLQIRDFLEKKLQYRYVKPEERKQFLNEVINRITKRNGPRRLTSGEIPEHIQLEIGAILVSIMKSNVKVSNRHGQKTNLLVEEKKIYKDENGMKTVILLKINEDFLATIVPKLQKQGDLFLHQERSVSTIVPPLPWVEPEVGGYYLQATNFMRYSECKVQERLVKYADLKRLFGVLNYLGSIPWKINTKVLAVVEQIWSEGGNQGQIPKRYSQLITKYTNKLKLEKNSKKISQIRKVIQELRDEYSDKCSFIFKLNTARAFSRVKYFYFPHNIDFRGRVYPVPPHLNHMGNDLSRGMLLLGKGQKLGKSGLDWLKIHCANLMGKDKATIPQKLAFIQDNIDLINAMGKDPLKNRQWIQNQDCWQSLGAILELYDAMNSPNPEEFVSHLHIHQDGSCNGLQHYAALGRDMEGAYQVNLGVTQRPGDVYTYVAKMVIKMLEQAIEDPNDPHRQMAIKLKQNIKRKTIKQTVMTSVYGVTFIGARQQIHRQLKDQNFLSEDDSYKASVYVATLTLRAISNLFTGAHHIKKWLISCAKLIGDYNCPVGWITPMGLPVVQPYRTLSKLDAISTVSQLLKVPTNNQMLPINKNKQKSAFPPNFVHSLDSTHMLYTAEQCNKRNISFAAVHDSYWTHAGKVQEMNGILRDQFVKLHSQPILQNLKKSFEKRFPQITFPDIPERGTFDLENVKQSIFFFS